MGVVEFADGPFAGKQHDVPGGDDELLTVVVPRVRVGADFMTVQIRYRRDGLTAEGLPRYVQC